MEAYEELKAIFETAEDPDKAVAMSQYMRNQFLFYGIPAPERRNLQGPILKREGKMLSWHFMEACYSDPHREFQYAAAVDLLQKSKKHLQIEDVEKIKSFIVTRSWWDTVDAFHPIFADLAKRESRIRGLMLRWARNENLWVRRTAILHQLSLKEHTDRELLSRIILDNTGSQEFFINKAIGWSLREYAKTDPEWVTEFLKQYEARLDPLSIHEALRHLRKK